MQTHPHTSSHANTNARVVQKRTICEFQDLREKKTEEEDADDDDEEEEEEVQTAQLNECH